MSSSAIIVGAKGRFGRAATQAFDNAGWRVKAFARNWPAGRDHTAIERVEGDAFDAQSLTEACRDVDVIVNALNPPYPRWRKDLPRLTKNVLAAARSSGGTVMIPGNVYNYGAQMSPILTEHTPQNPTTRKGKLRREMERSYREAAQHDVQTIILRGGDFIEREKTGNWFDSYITAKIHQGKVVYPGRLDATHAWAYLPDMARAMVGLAETRDQMNIYEEFGFEGFNITGAELVEAIEMSVGSPLKVRKLPWTLLKAAGLAVPLIKEVIEMKYLWDTPHAIDGSKSKQALPSYQPTSLNEALRQIL